MKTYFLILLVQFCFLSAKMVQQYNDFEHFAINSIVKSQLASQNVKIDFVSCGTNERLNQRIIHRTLLNRGNFLSIKLKSCDSKKIELENSAVLTLHSTKQFYEIFPKISWKLDKWRSYPHLVHIAKSTIHDLRKLKFNGYLIDKVAFLVNKKEKSIDLVTSIVFTKEKCEENQFVTINRFDKDTMKWENDRFYPRKYRNFHKCPLTVGRTAKIKKKSFDIVIKEMSEALNFEVVNIESKSFADLETLYRNNTCDFVGLPFSPKTHLFIVLGFEYGTFFVPPGSQLNQVEKLMLPFDTETWIWIAGTLMCAFVTIQVISLLSKRAKDACFGKNVDSPSMNLLSIFFCGGQSKVPENSWARCIFLTFIAWSLIIRTCFQSLSYRALQMDLRHSPMKTIQDLQRSGFHQLAPDQFTDEKLYG